MAEGWATRRPRRRPGAAPAVRRRAGIPRRDRRRARRGAVTRCRSPGPWASPVEAEYLVTDDGTAWIESATAAGLHLVPADRRDPTRTTSRGVGELMAAALAGGRAPDRGRGRGHRHLRRGSGPPGGPRCHVAASRGAVPRRWRAGRPDRARPRPGPGRRRRGARWRSPPTSTCPCSVPAGRPAGFAPQKGATPEQVEQLEAAMTHWASTAGPVRRRAVGRGRPRRRRGRRPRGGADPARCPPGAGHRHGAGGRRHRRD